MSMKIIVNLEDENLATFTIEDYTIKIDIDNNERTPRVVISTLKACLIAMENDPETRTDLN